MTIPDLPGATVLVVQPGQRLVFVTTRADLTMAEAARALDGLKAAFPGNEVDLVCGVDAVIHEWRDEWRVSIITSSGAREPWSFCRDMSVAQRDVDTAVFEGWPEPWIEHRRVGATDWERVAADDH